MKREISSVQQMLEFGEALGAVLGGGEVIELVGDIGAGKTTLTKGIARGLGIDEDVQSPTFTISRVYGARDGLELAHYDFYRLSDPGVLRMEVDQTAHDARTVTIIEWGGIVKGVLPDDRLKITITSPSETTRHLEVEASGPLSQKALGVFIQ